MPSRPLTPNGDLVVAGRSVMNTPARPARQSCIIKDYIERAAWTAGQVFFSVLLAIDPNTGFFNLPWEIAAATSAGAAIVSLLTTALLHIGQLGKRLAENFWPDLAMRLVKTFISAFLGTVGAMQFNVLTFDWSNALSLAAVATLGALGKGFLARGSNEDDNPSTLSGPTYFRAYLPGT